MDMEYCHIRGHCITTIIGLALATELYANTLELLLLCCFFFGGGVGYFCRWWTNTLGFWHVLIKSFWNVDKNLNIVYLRFHMYRCLMKPPLTITTISKRSPKPWCHLRCHGNGRPATSPPPPHASRTESRRTRRSAPPSHPWSPTAMTKMIKDGTSLHRYKPRPMCHALWATPNHSISHQLLPPHWAWGAESWQMMNCIHVFLLRYTLPIYFDMKVIFNNCWNVLPHFNM